MPSVLVTYLIPTFLLRAVYDVLPSLARLFTWGEVETPSCPLCSAGGTLEHMLSYCPTGLSQGRYTWRRNQALKPTPEAIGGDPGNVPELAALGGPGETAELPAAHCQHHPEARYLSGL